MQDRHILTTATTSANSNFNTYPAEAVHKAAVKCTEIYSRTLGKGLRKEVLEEMTQETEVKAYLYWDSFDPSKSKLETWVSRIAANCQRDVFRKEIRHAERFRPLFFYSEDGDEYINPYVDQAASGYEADRYVESHEAQDRIRDVWDSLPENQGTILSLTVEEGLKPKQIATVIGTTSQAVSSHLYRARQNFAQGLGKEFLADNGLAS
jgi:RNA polymerase sigma factor (sigma-70 family)